MRAQCRFRGESRVSREPGVDDWMAYGTLPRVAYGADAGATARRLNLD
jgi:hypothetical protein